MADKRDSENSKDSRRRKFEWQDGDVKWLVPPRQSEEDSSDGFNVRTRSRYDQD